MTDRQAEIFCTIGRVLTSSMNPKEVFQRVMDIIGDYFSPRDWSLLLLEKETGHLKFEIFMGVDAAKLQNVSINKGEGIVGWVCEHGQPALVTDTRNDSRFSSRLDEILGFTTRSVVCVPLLNGDNKVVGAIELINKIVPPSSKSVHGRTASRITPSEETFTETDMQILSAIGTFTGIAAQNAFLHQKVKEMSMVDPLTGIRNRHYFNEMLHHETERVKRYGNRICMLMIDADDFKIVNDTYGHLVGDEVLTAIAKILSDSVRDSDTLARFGGDEFVILMPNADLAAGQELANRIRKRIASWNDAPPIAGLTLSLSIGVHAAGPDDVEALLQQADLNLYRNKNYQLPPAELISEEEMRGYLWHGLSEKQQNP